MDYKLKMKEMLRKSGHSDINDEVINNFNYNLTNDSLFKDYFSEPKNLALFFKIYFNMDVNYENIIYLNNESTLHPKMKKTICDLKFKIDGEDTIFDIEMQNSGNEAIQKRIRAYFTSLSVESIKKGKDYDSNNVFLIWVFNTKTPLYVDTRYSVEVRVYSDFDNIFENNILKDKIIFLDLNKATYCGNIIVEAYSKMLQSSNNIKEYKNSSYQIIKEAALSMGDYLDRNNTLSMALRELLSELDYNLDMHEAETRGETKGETKKTRELVMKISKKGKSAEEIADLFDLDINYVQKILEANN